jgi:4-amino-4-deoxy-L-arabinose transferase-like glycosyltransferase
MSPRSTLRAWQPANLWAVLSATSGRRDGVQRLLGLVLLVGIALVWFGTLDARHLLRSDEGRYAEIAREMWVSGDWVTPRYNDLKYFEKPPAHLWMTALAFQAFGVGEWQARLWVAVSGAAGLLLTMLAAWRWWGPRVGMLSGLVLLAAPNWNLGSHFNSLDMSLSGALAAVLACTLLAQHPDAAPQQRRLWMLLAWAAAGVAVLTKGLVGLVLPALALLVYLAWTRDWRLWRGLHLASGGALMLLVCVPWFWLMAQRNPEFLQFFFIHEHFQRYTSSVHQRGAPVWYFVPQLLGGFLPWLGLWLAMAGRVWREPRQRGFRPLALLAAWALAIFCFFSASGSKLPGYILPMMPALAILGALVLDQMSPRSWSRQLHGALVVALLLTVAAPLVAQLSSDTTPNALFRAYAPWLVAAGALLVLGGLAALWLHRRGRQQASMVVYGLAMFVGTTVGLVGHDTLGRSSSGIDLVPKIQAVLTPDMPLYGVKLLDHTVPFYLRRTLVMVAEPDELKFGVQREPQKWLPTMAAFSERWRSGAPALALMSPATFASPEVASLPAFVIARDARRVVVANFRPPAAP